MLVGGAPHPSYELAGFLSPVPDQAGFAIPVFRGPASNRPVLQIIGADGRIATFRDLPDNRHVRDRPDAAVKVAQGDPALWAFLDHEGGLIVRPRDELAAELASPRHKSDEPFLQLQIAQFRGLERDLVKRWRDVFDHMGAAAPRSAKAWRDVVVIPAGVRAAVLNATALHGLHIDSDDLRRAVSVSVEREALVVSLEPLLYDTMSAHPDAARALRKGTQPLRRAFNLRQEVTIRAASATRRSPDEKPERRTRVIAVGDLAARLLRHSLSKERSANGTVRRIPMWSEGHRPLVAVLDGTDLRLERAGDPPRLELREGEILLVVVQVSEAAPELVQVAIALANAHRSRGNRVVLAVPHMPSELAAEPEILHWLALAKYYDAVWAVSDLSPHTRQSLAYGGGHSLAAASKRLDELIALCESDDFPLVGRSGLDGAEINVLGSATGNLSFPALLDHAAMKVATPSVDLSISRVAIIGLGRQAIDANVLERTVSAIARDAVVTRFALPHELDPDLGLIGFAGVRVRPVNLEWFEKYCLDRLSDAGWRVVGPQSGTPPSVEGSEGLWTVSTSPGHIARPEDLARHWRPDLHEIRVTDRTIGRRDFLAGVLFNSVPVNANRLPVLEKVLRGRWRTALSIARERKMDVTDILFLALRERVRERLRPRARTEERPLPSFTLEGPPELHVLGNHVLMEFDFLPGPDMSRRRAQMRLGADGIHFDLIGLA